MRKDTLLGTVCLIAVIGTLLACFLTHPKSPQSQLEKHLLEYLLKCNGRNSELIEVRLLATPPARPGVPEVCVRVPTSLSSQTSTVFDVARVAAFVLEKHEKSIQEIILHVTPLDTGKNYPTTIVKGRRQGDVVRFDWGSTRGPCSLTEATFDVDQMGRSAVMGEVKGLLQANRFNQRTDSIFLYFRPDNHRSFDHSKYSRDQSSLDHKLALAFKGPTRGQVLMSLIQLPEDYLDLSVDSQFAISPFARRLRSFQWGARRWFVAHVL